MRIEVHRKELGLWILIGTAVLYIKESGVWRLATRAEADILKMQSGLTTSNPPIEARVNLPTSDMGENDDFYALLYPVGWTGEPWDGEDGSDVSSKYTVE